MRTLTRRVAALAIVPTLTLAGCGGSDNSSDDDAPDSDSSASSTTDAPDDADDAPDSDDAAGGNTVKGTDYSYSLPKGWEVPTQKIPGTEQTDSFGADLTDADGFADNVNVIRLDPAPIDDLDKLEPALTAELKQGGSKDVTVRDRGEVAGDEAVHVSSIQEQQGKQYLTEQYNAIHDGVSYVITFSFSDTVSEDDRDDIAESVLDSWSWTK